MFNLPSISRLSLRPNDSISSARFSRSMASSFPERSSAPCSSHQRAWSASIGVNCSSHRILFMGHILRCFTRFANASGFSCSLMRRYRQACIEAADTTGGDIVLDELPFGGKGMPLPTIVIEAGKDDVVVGKFL